MSDHETKHLTGAPQSAPLAKGYSSVRDMGDAYDDLAQTFEAFKSANDERLGELEKKLSADVLTESKVDRLNEALGQQKRVVDELLLKQRRPGMDAGETRDPRGREHKSAFERYVRKGDSHGLLGFESKALSLTSDPDGGFLVPSETESVIERVLAQISPMREIASVRQIGATAFRKPIGGTGSGWVSETSARPQTATPQLSFIEFPTMELYAMPAATQTLLDDAQVNIEDWLAGEVQIEFAHQEGAAFINGDGINKPKGLLSYAMVADSSWAWGQLGFVTSGAAGAFASTDPVFKLLDLVYAPKQAYRANARWLMNRKVESEVRKLTDGQGNYIWQPGLQAGQLPSLLGYPVTEAEDMPDMAANSFSIAFGDFLRGYLVVDRVGMRVLRDPSSAKPYVLFYTTKRVGGGVQNFEAIKLMKFA